MAIVTKTINGYGPYEYKVTYENGEHHWEYIGPAGEGSSDGDTTPDSNQNQTESAESISIPEYVDDDVREMIDSLDDVTAESTDDAFQMKGEISDSSKLSDGTDEVNVTFVQTSDGQVQASIGVDTPKGKRGTSWTVQDSDDVDIMTEMVSKSSDDNATMYWDTRNAGVRFDVGNGETVDVNIRGRQKPSAEINSGGWMGNGSNNTTSIEDVTAYVEAVENYESYGSESDISAITQTETQYGTKVGITSPYGAKENIDELDFNEYHQTWDGDLDMWFVDKSKTGEVAEKLRDDGWSVDTGDF